MKIKPEYRVRKAGGINIVVSTKGTDFNGIMRLNETGEFIWNMLTEGAEYNEIITTLAKECGMTEADISADVDDFINSLKEAEMLE